MPKISFILLCAMATVLGGCTGAGDRCGSAVVECGCPGGARGAQFCQPDGSLGRCECPGVELESARPAERDSPQPSAETAPIRAAHPGDPHRRRPNGAIRRPNDAFRRR